MKINIEQVFNTAIVRDFFSTVKVCDMDGKKILRGGFPITVNNCTTKQLLSADIDLNKNWIRFYNINNGNKERTDVRLNEEEKTLMLTAAAAYIEGINAGNKREEVNDSQYPPMVREYRRRKRNDPTTLLLFRCGDFYETYEEDAITICRITKLTLITHEIGGIKVKVYMGGFPLRALGEYKTKLEDAGYKVDLIEQ